jgi:2-isopropylmalate synthase
MNSRQLIDLFSEVYHSGGEYELMSYQASRENQQESLSVKLYQKSINAVTEINQPAAKGGLMMAFANILQGLAGDEINIIDYQEQTASGNSDALAECYVQLSVNGETVGGFGRSVDVIEASLQALLSAYQHALQQRVQLQKSA